MQITGTWISPEIAIPDDAATTADLKVRPELARCTALNAAQWADPSCFVEVLLEISLDGGKTWLTCGGWGAYGGVHRRRDGSEAPSSYGNFPFLKGANRLGRVTITASKVCETTVTVNGVELNKNGRTDIRQLSKYI